MSFESIIKTINSVFGTSVTYSYISGDPNSTLKGVFDNAFVEVNGVSTRKPILKIALIDLTSEPVEGDTLLIGSTSYTVQDHQPDSFGTTVLILEKN